MSELLGSVFFADGEYLPGEKFPRFESLLENNASVYEVIRVEEGIPLFFEDYMERLNNSFRMLGRSLPHGEVFIREIIQQLFKINGKESGPVKLVFGFDDPAFFFAFLMKANVPEPAEYLSGVKTMLLEESRSNPNLKIWNSELRERSIEQMEKQGAYEAILVNPDGIITEASRSNVFFIKEGKVYTTPVKLVLPGITRKKVIEVCSLAGIEIIYKQIHVSALQEYEACFLTGTARKVVPIQLVNDIQYNANAELMCLISERFEAFVLNYLASHA